MCAFFISIVTSYNDFNNNFMSNEEHYILNKINLKTEMNK